jgi:hypothetical protein
MTIKGAIAGKKLDLKCYFCSAQLRTDNAYFEIYDQEQRPFTSDRTNHVRFNEHGGKEIYGALAYPGNGEDRWENCTRVVVFAHGSCGPDCGYAFSFDRLGEDWDRQLSGKTWYCDVIGNTLKVAQTAMKKARSSG